VSDYEKNRNDDVKNLSKNSIVVIDEKNGVKCEYNNDFNKARCFVLEDQGLDERVVSHMIEQFSDSQPEYYRTDYHTLL